MITVKSDKNVILFPIRGEEIHYDTEINIVDDTEVYVYDKYGARLAIFERGEHQISELVTNLTKKELKEHKKNNPKKEFTLVGVNTNRSFEKFLFEDMIERNLGYGDAISYHDAFYNMQADIGFNGIYSIKVKDEDKFFDEYGKDRKITSVIFYDEVIRFAIRDQVKSFLQDELRKTEGLTGVDTSDIARLSMSMLNSTSILKSKGLEIASLTLNVSPRAEFDRAIKEYQSNQAIRNNTIISKQV